MLLPSESIDRVWSTAMSVFSSFRRLIPINKHQLRGLFQLMDQELESAEVSIIQALPAGTGKAWLIANPALGRELMARILDERQEVL